MKRIAFAAALVTTALTALVSTPVAQASKEAVDFIGGSGTLGGQFGAANGGVAVNTTGTGPANVGDVYVADATNNRIERFGRDEHGTPGDTSDDTYFFISAWGADVVSPGGSGDVGDAAAKAYEICTVAAQCKAGVGSGGNGAVSGNGALSSARSIALDPDTGELYVFDTSPSVLKNNRVNVYEGDGTFLRSFGYDVVESGPGDEGTGYEICAGADGDVCKSGVAGAGTGQIGPVSFRETGGIALSPDGNPATGTVFLGDWPNQRVNTYALDGSTPGAIGSAAQFDAGSPQKVAVDSRGILYASNSRSAGGGVNDVKILRHDTTNANGEGVGFLPPLRASVSEVQQLKFNATAGQYRLTFEGETTTDIPYNANEETVKAALEALPAIGEVGVTNLSNEGQKYFPITFRGAQANTDLPQLIVSSGTTPLTGSITPTTVINGYGGGGANERQDLTVVATAGTYKLSFDPDGVGPKVAETTVDIPFNWPKNDAGAVLGNGDTIVNSVQDALEALPSVPGRSVLVLGGPGNAAGSSPYEVEFLRGLGATDVAQLTVVESSLAGGAGASVTTVFPGQAGLLPSLNQSLAIDPDEDGAGPDTDTLYAGFAGAIQQFGPLNAPGLPTPPANDDDRHGTGPAFTSHNALAAEPATGRLYVAASGSEGPGVYVLDDVNPEPPEGSLDSIDEAAANGLTAHATLNPHGQPASSYRFEYVDDATFQASGFAKAARTPTVLLGGQETPQAVVERIEPPGTGLLPNTLYHVRMVYQRRFATEQLSNELSAPTLASAPSVETAGSPLRTAHTATLFGRVLPNGTATTYRFQYGAQGPCDSSPCTETAPIAAGAGQETELASQQVIGLSPSTTYHYRIAADNGEGGIAYGGDRTLTTRASDAPLTHGRFPGPPGSDRAYEMVSLADSSGNPVSFLGAKAFAADANRAIYTIFGGTPISDSGSAFSLYFAQRPAGAHPTTGWQTRSITPPRAQSGRAQLGRRAARQPRPLQPGRHQRPLPGSFQRPRRDPLAPAPTGDAVRAL